MNLISQSPIQNFKHYINSSLTFFLREIFHQNCIGRYTYFVSNFICPMINVSSAKTSVFLWFGIDCQTILSKLTDLRFFKTDDIEKRQILYDHVQHCFFTLCKLFFLVQLYTKYILHFMLHLHLFLQSTASFLDNYK